MSDLRHTFDKDEPPPLVSLCGQPVPPGLLEIVEDDACAPPAPVPESAVSASDLFRAAALRECVALERRHKELRDQADALGNEAAQLSARSDEVYRQAQGLRRYLGCEGMVLPRE